MQFLRRRYLLLAGTGLWFVLAGVCAWLLWGVRGASGGAPADVYALGDSLKDGELPVLWEVPEFSFVSQTKDRVTPETLRGRVWIADFIFTQCTSVCPLITARMTALQRSLPGEDLRFVSFSVDPANDTAEVLAEYARTWSPKEDRWTLLQTTPKALEEVARGMRVAVAPTEDPENPILHTDLFMLVDRQGQVRGVYDSSDSVAVRRLERDARSLLGSDGAPAAATTARRSGAEVYEALRCAACHDDPKVAPSLAGVAGRTVMLERGGQVVADAEYLRRALTEPGVEVVAGYLPLMPSYQSELAPEDVDALVEYLQGLAPASDTQPASGTVAQLAVDPLCKMQVRVAPDALQAVRDGETFYFCSPVCKQRFEQQTAARKK